MARNVVENRQSGDICNVPGAICGLVWLDRRYLVAAGRNLRSGVAGSAVFDGCWSQFAVWCGWIGGVWWILVAICGLVWLDRRYLMAAGRNLRSIVVGSAVFGGCWSQFALWCVGSSGVCALAVLDLWLIRKKFVFVFAVASGICGISCF